MRNFVFGLVIASACASTSTNRPVNVAVIRHEIVDAIAKQSAAGQPPRSIVSMGHVSADSAVVYTQTELPQKHEETWVHSADGWKLQDTKDLAVTKPPAPSAN